MNDLSRIDRPNSRAAHERAKRVIPGGVNSPARAFGGVGGTPITIQRAQGPYLYDVDGNRYLDFIGSWGPMILGHGHPAVLNATIAAMKDGSSYGAPCEKETELAEMVIAAMPSVEMVRFVSSGTEATMSAIRLARGYTGRDLIVKFAGCYHGHVDSLLVAAGSSALTLGVPNSPGIPKGCTQDTLILQYNDVTQLAEVFAAKGDAIAGVILEPVVGNMGLIPPSEEFRKELRRLTAKHGALLIYDEVMTGFRLAYGGAQELFGDTPDLTCLGKIIGGGYPVGAYGGRRDILEKVMPAGPVFQAGTLSGNPVAMAAGIATLRELKANPPYARLDAQNRRIGEGLLAAAQDAGHAARFQRIGSMWTLFFATVPIVDYASAVASDKAKFARFFWAMMDRGVYLPCSQFEAAFTCAAMTDANIDETLAAARDALASLAQ
ncbi:MAG: glutamate-1-semialdehyde 2,1-aminomutase [Gemmataceae bacterium]|nr:glutamate-1-semialdehyde 2,1-aminomutase [Gemmataceae bacterium]